MHDLRAIVGLTPGPGHGECFIWKRDSDAVVVAVDAGGAASVGKHAGASDPAILILSHDDSDHIRGAVALINAAKASLRELWVPAEWAILIKQISETDQSVLLSDDVVAISVSDLEASIADQIATTADSADSNELSAEILSRAATNLFAWDIADPGFDRGFSITYSPLRVEQWYGAANLDEIVKRVRFRAKTLIAILRAALTNSVRIRFFSIDLALATTSKTWETAGRAGTVTIANASEAPHALAVRIPPGLAQSYALTRLTVQNRRALCTLLWSDPSKTRGAITIWSDTDGNWLNHSSSLGFGQVVSTLIASSAPHHASANPAHDRVWKELGRAPDRLIMISAGGQKHQSYRPQYKSLTGKTSCTWCRPASTTYQEVRASWGASGNGILHQSCIGSH